jgi:hypothetical protein
MSKKKPNNIYSKRRKGNEEEVRKRMAVEFSVGKVQKSKRRKMVQSEIHKKEEQRKECE